MNLDLAFFGPQDDYVWDTARFVAYFGGIGSGKTLGLVGKALIYMLKHPGAPGVITAPTYPMLRDVTIPAFFELCPITAGDWSKQDLVFTLPNGSRAFFRSAHEPNKLRGPNLAFGAMDEASLSPKLSYDVMVGRIRLPGYRQQLWLAYTPQGYNWCYDEFGPKALRTYPDHSAHHCPTYGNPHLSVEYLASLVRQYGGKQSSFYLQEVEGQYVGAQGLVYPEFREQSHVGDYPYDPSRPVQLAIDFGYANPYAILAVQQDSYGRLYVVDEEYRVKHSDEEMVAILRGKPYWGKISYAVADEAEPDRIERLRSLKLPVEPSTKGRIAAGIARMRELLAVDPVLQTPFLLIDRRCVSTIQEFGRYAYADPKEDRNTNEEPVDAYNHALSALRYLVVTRWSRTANPAPVTRPVRRRMAYERL